MTYRLDSIKNFLNEPFTFFPIKFNPTIKSDADFTVEEGLFYMETFRNLKAPQDGLPVAISYAVRRRKYILCVQDNTVTLKEGELPNVPAENSEFIFYKRESPSEDGTNYTFESSAKSGFYLACSEDGQNVTLKPYAEEDRTTRIFIDLSELLFKPDDELTENTPYHIQNSHDEFLIAQPEDSIATFKSDGDAQGERAIFYMNIYKELGSGNGLPMILSCRVGNKNYLLSAASNSVSLKEGELPSVIPTRTSELIFYTTYFSSGRPALRFESSAAQKFCLAWSVQDPGKKLILNQYLQDAINERMTFFAEAKN